MIATYLKVHRFVLLTKRVVWLVLGHTDWYDSLDHISWMVFSLRISKIPPSYCTKGNVCTLTPMWLTTQNILKPTGWNSQLQTNIVHLLSCLIHLHIVSNTARHDGEGGSFFWWHRTVDMSERQVHLLLEFSHIRLLFCWHVVVECQFVLKAERLFDLKATEWCCVHTNW